jgi:hypothetical protein
MAATSFTFTRRFSLTTRTASAIASGVTTLWARLGQVTSLTSIRARGARLTVQQLHAAVDFDGFPTLANQGTDYRTCSSFLYASNGAAIFARSADVMIPALQDGANPC